MRKKSQKSVDERVRSIYNSKSRQDNDDEIIVIPK